MPSCIKINVTVANLKKYRCIKINVTEKDCLNSVMKRKKIMSLNSRQELLESIRKEYKKASKPRKSQLLDSLCLSCNYNRKYAIRILHKQRSPKGKKYKNKVGRPPEYNDPLITEFILSLRIKTNLMCSRRLKEAVSNWINHYEPSTGQTLDDDVKDRLLRISSATIDRIVKKSNLCFEKIGFSTTKPGSIIKRQSKNKYKSMGRNPSRILRS